MIDPILMPSGVQAFRLPLAHPIPNTPLFVPLNFGVIYYFSMAGIAIPMHTHPSGKGHFCLILEGMFNVKRAGVDTLARAGDMLACLPGVPHSITCLRPGSLFNGAVPCLR